MNRLTSFAPGRAIFTLLSIVLSAYTAEAAEFALPTTDGLYTLTGQVDFPDQVQKSVPLVVMVPGTGLFDRDVLFGKTGTDRDFLFKEFSKKLNAAGIATLRFDYRGVT